MRPGKLVLYDDIKELYDLLVYLIPIMLNLYLARMNYCNTMMIFSFV